MIGKKFGYLKVIATSNPINGRAASLCLCDCGTEKIISNQQLLRKNNTKSCGCLNNKKRSVRAKHMYSQRQKYSPREASARKIWSIRYKDGNLLLEDFLILSQKNCFYCNEPPSNLTNSAKGDKKSSAFAKAEGDFIYNGLDRIDSTIPHNKDNVVTSCKFCNYAKRERSLNEFKEWIKKLYKTVFPL